MATTTKKKTIADIVKELSKPLPLDKVDFRVMRSGASAKGAWAQLLAYKDARTDVEMLNKATGGAWSNSYYRDEKGALVCRVGIQDPDTKEWYWKEDTGTESNTESQKGEYSDAFKRACFKWGIGVDLYDFPDIFVMLEQPEFSNGRPSFKFKPNDWTWTRDKSGKITAKQGDKVRFQEK